MSQYTVHALDVWGNDEDGYTVNNVLPSVGTIEIADDTQSGAILYALIAAGFVDPSYCDVGKVEIRDSEYDIDVEYDGTPELLLRKVQP